MWAQRGATIPHVVHSALLQIDCATSLRDRLVAQRLHSRTQRYHAAMSAKPSAGAYRKRLQRRWPQL